MTENTIPTSDTSAAAEAKPMDVGIRRVRMTISRVDPLSALKLSFLVSVGVGIMIVVAAILLWFTLDAMHVWARIEELLVTLNSAPLLELGQFMQFGRVVSFAVVVGVIEVVLMTALGTITALLYNVVAMLVGGLYITVTDE
ncbi:DUF3566 domain-containing protein [Trueperella pyogenes]|uniref:DUF3566 domain-containing protein n=1 Tax=Trueperella pyogenes TaxID=1661 RepID=UPI00043ACB59|nr:DUF3566 domain-containing protein [Trueperella pyogenes]AHU89854.1 hypothetical protein CQ11_07625 [Trueperella pyogenes]AJC68753.1 membrane protein [Trueperella pyogenes TP8]ALD73445.1 hypothetical protein AN946_02830 [Trueperella pyogenes]OQD36087.1 hypothetical protein B1R42_08015 [Trueperella pyogenes]UVJ55751.1 DUF3566 domain-containing protein [Trueperella pyogenes]